MSKKEIIYQVYNIVAALESLDLQLRGVSYDNPETIKIIKEWISHPSTKKRFGKYYDDLIKLNITTIYYLPKRIQEPINYIVNPLNNFANWIFSSKETTNFTYNLSDLNKEQLSWYISSITNEKVDVINNYINEIENDNNLKDHIIRLSDSSIYGFFSDLDVKYSRRVGWYAFIRILKPEIVLETGVDKGLGTCVIASALKKNSEEGKSGYLYAFDNVSQTGFLFQEPYNKFGEIIYSDAIDALKKFDKSVDIFIHDSMHEDNYEYNEYKAIEHCLKDDTLILSDDSTFSPSLAKFADETGRKFLFFKEEPKDHFYSGEGIGAAFK